jgi:ketosteroid isomerase-like protein
MQQMLTAIATHLELKRFDYTLFPAADGRSVTARVHEESIVKATGRPVSHTMLHLFELDGAGKVTKLTCLSDAPERIRAAFRGGAGGAHGVAGGGDMGGGAEGGVAEGKALVQRAFDSFKRKDVAGVLACFADDAEITADSRDPVRSLPFAGLYAYDGKEKPMARFLAELGKAVEFDRFDYQISGGDDGRVWATVQMAPRNPKTGATMESMDMHCFHIRNGKIARAICLNDRTEAMAALVSGGLGGHAGAGMV